MEDRYSDRVYVPPPPAEPEPTWPPDELSADAPAEDRTPPRHARDSPSAASSSPWAAPPNPAASRVPRQHTPPPLPPAPLPGEPPAAPPRLTDPPPAQPAPAPVPPPPQPTRPEQMPVREPGVGTGRHTRPADAPPPTDEQPTDPPVFRPGQREQADAVQSPPDPGPPPRPAATHAPQSTPAPEVVRPPTDGRVWPPGTFVPTAEEFAKRRAVRPADPVATMGLRAAVRRGTLGLVKLGPGRHERDFRQDVEMVRRNFGGLRQVTVVNPKGGAGKTVAVLLLGMTFGQKRGGYVLCWDNNETQGTLGMRAQQDFHARTVRDLLRDFDHFASAHGRVGDLSQYVRAQGEGMFDVLASDESATAGEMLTSTAFTEIREVVSRFYKLIVVDTGNNVRAANWQAAIDATDQLVVTMSARNDSAETAARMLDHLEQSGRQRLVRQAVTIVSMPPSRRDIDVPAIQRHFAARTRTVLLAPYEKLIDSGEPIRYGGLSSASRDAWLKITSAVAEGL